VCYTITLLLIVMASIRYAKNQDKATSRLLIGIAFLAVAASVGTPALTANRCATIMWLLLGLTIFCGRENLGIVVSYTNNSMRIGNAR
jgi:hypothetical protein